MSLLTLSRLSCRMNGRTVLAGVDLTVAAGEFVGLIGRNGAGKTTLLRAALGLIAAEGHSSLAAMPAGARARAAAFLPQSREIAWPVTVETLVALGRVAHPGSAAGADRAAVARALAALDLGPLRRRPATALSGGEQARALLARALAQDTPLLVADEPIAGLDLAAQIAVMGLFRRLAGGGRAVLGSFHDLGLAGRFCTRLVLLAEGRVLADGPPAEVLTPANLARGFGVRTRIEPGPDGPVIHLLGAL